MSSNKIKSLASNTTFTGGLLFLSAVAAFIWANVSPESYKWLWDTPHTINIGPHLEKVLENGVEVEKMTYFLSFTIKSLELLVNDLLMWVFFLSVGLEIKRELVAGKLSSVKKAILPVGAAIGGMLFPAAIYLIFGGEGMASRGWGIPMATDIAFSLAVMSLLVKHVPLALKVFLMALAVADDIGAMLVIAIFYTDHLNLTALVMGLVGILLLFIANRSNVRGRGFYYLFGLVLIWPQVLSSGVHATIAGLLTGFAFPCKVALTPKEYAEKAQPIIDRLRAKDAKTEIVKGVPSDEIVHDYAEMKRLTLAAENPMVTEEHTLAPYIAMIVMPIFALANAGVTLGDGGLLQAMATPVAMGVGLGLLVGKPLGIFCITYLFVKLGIGKLPEDVKWKQVVGMGVIAGMGFTMSIFVTSLAFRTGDASLIDEAAALTDQAKVSILIASMAAAVIGYTYLRLVSKKK